MNSTKTSSTAAEARRNAKAELAYRSMRDLGSIDPRNTALEGFAVPSLSEPGVTRTVAHDMASDRFHCDCTHGQHGGRGECYHVLAARRRVDERRAQWQAAYERDQATGGYGYNDTLNLMFGTQATSEY